MPRKVLVGMSGGVDSSVAAFLLKEQGFDIIGIHLRFWSDPSSSDECDLEKMSQNKCCTIESLLKAKQVCDRLGAPFYVLNFEDCFKKNVVVPFIKGYKNGITPNPCIECNKKIKFGLFIEKMKEFGADFIATGHYAKKITLKNKGKERYELWMAKDKNKDQSYFLYALSQEQLKHILFPLGEYTKKEVREIAKKYGIEEVNRQKESQNLCFIPEKKPNIFLKRNLKEIDFKPGPIFTTKGEKIGTHQGLPSYTIGQRKGIYIGGIKGREYEEGKPWYVIKIDKNTNSLIVGKNEELFSEKLSAYNLSFISERPTSKTQKIQAKIRYRIPKQNALLKLGTHLKGKKRKTAEIIFEKPQRAITPGQSVVFYEGEKVLGGGIIA